MNLFDRLVSEALKQNPDLSPLRIVVEKELLHHDILRILKNNNLLSKLTFIGGTALRSCYGGVRLSEDLDFTGGCDFSYDSLSKMGHMLTQSLTEKYGFQTAVSEPVKETKNVSTWKIKIETRPKQKHMPMQRINLDICSVPSYERQPMMLLNPYGIDMGTNGLIIQTQSLEEIYADKILAFALRPNRIKYRDLWDIAWLHQKNIQPKLQLIPNKLHDRHVTYKKFTDQFDKRICILRENRDVAIEFKKEMQRFLPKRKIDEIIEQNDLWPFIVYLMTNLKNLCFKQSSHQMKDTHLG